MTQPNSQDSITVYAVYKNPSDYPGKFVVRKFIGETPDVNPSIVADSLIEARKVIPRDKVRLTPSITDDPVIIETWL